jgi:8-oxo-dGTP diphosphatase
VKKTDADHLIRLLYRLGYRLYLGFCYIFRPASQGVYVAVWHAGCVLLIQNSYKSFFNIPGGGRKAAELPEVAAARELYEEVGISVDPKALHPVGKFQTGYEFTRDSVALFEVTFAERPGIEVDHREVVWAEFKSPAAALQLELYPVLRRYIEKRNGK